MRLVVPLLLCALALPGCALFESPADRAMKASPDYRAGYSDGCTSSEAQGANMRVTGLTRDENAYRTNKAYRAGWGTGLGACRPYQSAPVPAGGPIQDREPGAQPF